MSQGRQPREVDRSDPNYFYQNDEDRRVGGELTRRLLEVQTWKGIPEELREVVVFVLNQHIENDGGILDRVAGRRDAQADALRRWQHVYRLAIAHLRKIG
jgi:hypothetical protein